MNTYGDDIIKLLLEAVSPKLICTALRLCTTAELVVMPVVEIGEWMSLMGTHDGICMRKGDISC